jgi:hypothetical protein
MAGVLVVGMLLGFACGRRKALAEALKKAMDKMKASRADKEMKKMMDAGAGQDDKEEEEDEEAKKQEAKQLLEQFLNRSAAPGMDDHPQAFINPILMLQIKKKKEEVQRDKMYEKLLASQEFEEGYLESLSLAEWRAKAEELLAAEGGSASTLSGGVGSVPGVERRWGANVNSTRILVDAGATFVLGKGKVEDAASLDEKLMLEVRDKMKQIDTHLNKHYEIDVVRDEAAKARNKRSGDGKRLKDALTVANETKNRPFQMSHEVMTFDERRDFAQRGRARVAPPQDHAGQSGGVRSAAGGRRASAAGNALALDAAMQEAKEQERKDREALQAVQGGGLDA